MTGDPLPYEEAMPDEPRRSPDGRRLPVYCKTCADHQLVVDADLVDGSLYVRCSVCERDIGIGTIEHFDAGLAVPLDDLDELDPRLRETLEERLQA